MRRLYRQKTEKKIQKQKEYRQKRDIHQEENIDY